MKVVDRTTLARLIHSCDLRANIEDVLSVRGRILGRVILHSNTFIETMQDRSSNLVAKEP